MRVKEKNQGFNFLLVLVLVVLTIAGASLVVAHEAKAAADNDDKNHNGKNIEMPTGGVEIPEIEIKGEVKKDSASKRSAGLKASSSVDNPCTTLNEAGKELARKLANRESNPVIVCSEDFGAREIMNEALKHVKIGCDLPATYNYHC